MNITLALRQQEIYLHKASPEWNEQLQHMSMTRTLYWQKKSHRALTQNYPPLSLSYDHMAVRSCEALL